MAIQRGAIEHLGSAKYRRGGQWLRLYLGIAESGGLAAFQQHYSHRCHLFGHIKKVARVYLWSEKVEWTHVTASSWSTSRTKSVLFPAMIIGTSCGLEGVVNKNNYCILFTSFEASNRSDFAVLRFL